MPESKAWLVYVLIAGLSWGTYVPMIAFGGRTLGGNRFGALLCVGVAYFLIAVLLPLGMFISGQEKWPPANVTGLTFSALAGVAGAVGALGVIFATKAAGGPRSSNSMYIAPLIFGLAPVINTVISLFWHPSAEHPLHFANPDQLPGWKMIAGIVFVAIGAALVLFSKEEEERQGTPKPAPAAMVNSPPPSSALPS